MNVAEQLKLWLLKRLGEMGEIQLLLGELRAVHSLKDLAANALILFRLVQTVVLLVEEGSGRIRGFVRDLQGEDKQRAAAEALDALLPLPIYLEWADGMVFRFLINLAVQRLNVEHGHDWGDVSLSPEIAEEDSAPGERRPAERSGEENGLSPEDVDVAMEAFKKGQEVPSDVKERISGMGAPKPVVVPSCGIRGEVQRAVSTDRFAICLASVLGFEGGYSNNPADRGGATNLGITQGTLDRAHAAGIVSHRDVRRLTRAEAAAVYRRFYWDLIGGDALPQPLDMVLFDAAVNCGVGAATKLLQEGLNALLPRSPLTVDGGYGPKTREALEKVIALDKTVTAANPGLEEHSLLRYLALDVQQNRVELYDAIAGKSASQRVFLRGWIHRVVDLAAKAEMEA